MLFSKILIDWYLQNKRDLPWRNTQNPYHIWLSEIMLQQTRVNQGMPFYLKFVDAFPTVFDLANASEEQVLKLWQGLGYYSRARNLHFTAKEIAFKNNGIFPNSYITLQQLKGVGDYTAAAIASFSYNEVIPVVDGNVFRVLARIFDIKSDIAASRTKKEFFELSQSLISQQQPALYNQAIMEFGALQCIPQNPNCEICVMNHLCLAKKHHIIKELPFKSKKVKVKNRYFNYAIIKDSRNHLMHQQRTEKDIWQHLYEFPLIETSNEINTNEFENLLKTKKLFTFKVNKVTETKNSTIIHKLTHQKLHIKFRIVEVEGIIENSLNTKDFALLPLPIAINDYLKQLSF